MKKIIIASLIASSLVAGEIACEYHLKETRGLFNTAQFAIEQGDVPYAKKTAIKFKRSLYLVIENCEPDNAYISVYKRILSSFKEAGFYDK